MKYLLYTRCSSEEQKKGFSHEYQLSGLMSSPKIKEGTFIRAYQDTITGTSFDRPELDKMYKYCYAHRGEINSIFVYKWDRFGRDVLEAFQTIEKFRLIGIRIDCPDFSIDFLDTNWPVLLAVQMGIAQSESLKIADRTKDGNYTALKNGYYIASPPVGYQRTFIDNHASLKVDPEKGPIVRKIFEKVAAGEIAKVLFRTYSERLNIRQNNFYHMLRNKVYIGINECKAYKHYPAVTVKAKHEPLVTRPIFDRVQHNLENNTRKPTNQAAESAKLYAKGCLYHQSGQVMTAYYSKNKSGRLFPYYEAKGIKGSILNANRVHDAIESVIKRLTLDIPPNLEASAKGFFIDQVNSDKSQKFTLEKSIIDKKQFKEKLEKDYVKGSITADQFTLMHQKMSEEIEESKREIESINKKSLAIEASFKIFFEHLKNLHQMWAQANEIKKTLILQTLFPDGFYIDRENYTFRTPKLNKVVLVLCSESSIWEEIKTHLPLKKETSAILGPTSHSLRTDIDDFMRLIA